MDPAPDILLRFFAAYEQHWACLDCTAKPITEIGCDRHQQAVGDLRFATAAVARQDSQIAGRNPAVSKRALFDRLGAFPR